MGTFCLSGRKTTCTVVTFLLDLGQKVFSWVTVKIISHFLSNIIKYTIIWHFNYKNSNYHQEILQKILKNIFFGSTRDWTRDLKIVRPACYKRAIRILTVEKDFLWFLKKYLVFKRFLHSSLPCLQSWRKNSQNFLVATWFSQKMVKSGPQKQFFLHYSI